ncbi:MAG: hypothetical protein ACD_11C00004G0018 [uncultured bacterium]|nr:MAG: hypothetical protein ACD_11C00004G0018 [uncultured bacterium]HBR71652.1 hypothetical protein [Candidatus Moranbacteria bacterium]
MLKNKTKNKNKFGSFGFNSGHLNRYRGFTLLETLVVVFIFTLVMISFTEYFAKFSQSEKDAKEIQANLENAQYAMNFMAKILRTSSIRFGSGLTRIKGYDYSQEKCFEFNFDIGSKKIVYGTEFVPSIANVEADCTSPTPPPMLDLTSETISDLKFSFEKSSEVPPQMGKVTIFMEVGTGSVKEKIQTTVSLRDYSVAGIE